VTKFRLPKQIRLPGRFTVKIEVVSMTGDDQAEYVYDDNGGVIRLNKGLTLSQQKFYLGHEILHCAIDYYNLLLQTGAKP